MKTIFIVTIVLGILAVTFLTLGGVFWGNEDWQDCQYQGQISFSTEAEYSAFKQDIVDYDAKIMSIDVLSSEPPIIVRFKVDTPEPAIQDFPHGEKNVCNPNAAGFFIYGGASLFFLILLCGTIFFHIKSTRRVRSEAF